MSVYNSVDEYYALITALWLLLITICWTHLWNFEQLGQFANSPVGFHRDDIIPIVIQH